MTEIFCILIGIFIGLYINTKYHPVLKNNNKVQTQTLYAASNTTTEGIWREVNTTTTECPPQGKLIGYKCSHCNTILEKVHNMDGYLCCSKCEKVIPL